MATPVNMHEAKSSLSQLVKRAEAGEDVIIARNGRPVARLTRIKKSAPKLPWGIFKGKIWMADDFDAPLEEFKDYL
jgi:prevent-host-death family protein